MQQELFDIFVLPNTAMTLFQPILRKTTETKHAFVEVTSPLQC